jgi:predicted ester cyclase
MNRNRRQAQRAVEDLWNKGEIGVADELTSPEARGYAAGEGMTRDDLKVAVEEFRAAFPDVQMTIDQQVAEGDYVVNFTTLRGTQRGEFRGIQPTGKSITVSGVSRLHYGPDGKVIDEWIQFDQLGMLEQLGAVPSAETPKVAPRFAKKPS